METGKPRSLGDLMTLKELHSSRPRSINTSVSSSGRRVAVNRRVLTTLLKQKPNVHTVRNRYRYDISSVTMCASSTHNKTGSRTVSIAAANNRKADEAAASKLLKTRRPRIQTSSSSTSAGSVNKRVIVLP